MSAVCTNTRAVLVPLDSIPAQPVHWLWPGVIPRGKLTLLAGDPGLGKSFITLDIAARASRATPFPGSEPPPEGLAPGPIGTVLLAADDDPADTLRPRLESLGADLSRILILQRIDQRRAPIDDHIIGEHIRLLDEALAGLPDCGLLVVDPVSAYLASIDSCNGAQVRANLRPLADLAARRGIAVLLVTRLRKDESARLLRRAIGSVPLAAASRVVLAAVRNPRDPGRRAMVVLRSNLADDQAAMSYTIDQGGLAWGEPIDPASLTEATSAPGASPTNRAALDEAVQEILQVIARDGRINAEECRQIARRHRVNDRFVGFSDWKRAHALASRRIDGAWWIVPDDRTPHTQGDDPPAPPDPDARSG